MWWTGRGTVGKYCSSTAELSHHKFPLVTSDKQQGRDAAQMPCELSFCGFFKIIWWIVWIRLAMRWCATEEILLSIIFALIHQLIEGLTRLGKDWTLMLQSYLCLLLEVFDKDWIQAGKGPASMWVKFVTFWTHIKLSIKFEGEHHLS